MLLGLLTAGHAQGTEAVAPMLSAGQASSLTASPAAQVVAPGTTVRCEVDYGGERQHLLVPPVDSPYNVLGTEVGSYFLFRVVNQGQPADLASVKVYTYANHDRGAALIHQATYASAAHLAATASTSAAPHPARWGFTGLQTVYEPVRDGELHYWCEVQP